VIDVKYCPKGKKRIYFGRIGIRQYFNALTLALTFNFMYCVVFTGSVQVIGTFSKRKLYVTKKHFNTF